MDADCDLDEKDLERAAEDALDEVYDDNDNGSGSGDGPHRRMKNDNAFGFVIDNCNKKTVEKELEDGISSAYSSGSKDSRESER